MTPVLACILSVVLGVMFVLISDCNSPDGPNKINALGPAIIVSMCSGGIVACLMWRFLH